MTKSVCQFILEKYGLEARVSKKGECPFCGHNTLSVHPNDTFAKCFHPSCGKFISAKYDGFSHHHSYYEILEEIYRDWKEYFLSLEQEREYKDEPMI